MTQTKIRNDVVELESNDVKVNETLKLIGVTLNGVLCSVNENGKITKELEVELQLLKTSVANQYKKLVEFKDKSRRNNLVAFGIHERETRGILKQR